MALLPTDRSKAKMAAKLPISFDDVESILKTVEYSIGDKLPELDLLPFLSCIVMAYRMGEIQADATQHGDSSAASTVFDAVRVRPDVFLRMGIELKKINLDLYQTVWKIICKHFSEREDKMKDLEDWVEKEYGKLIGNNESDDESGIADDEGAQAGPSLQKTGSPDRQPTAAMPDPCIDDLHNHSFFLVAQELEKPSSDHDGKIGWEVLITENKDIPISRKDQRFLAESRTPGTDLLDLLASRNCTVSNLGAWLKNCGLHGTYRKFADNLSVVCSNNPGAQPTLLPPPYDKNEEGNKNICQQNQPSRHIHLQTSASDLPCQILTKKASDSKVLNNLEPVVQHGEPAGCNENNSTDRSVDPLIEEQCRCCRFYDPEEENIEALDVEY